MTTASPVVEGTCDGRFTRLKQRFIENFTTFGETGAALAITLDNRPVVDIWAGHADRTRTRPWQRDTIVNVYSTTKGVTAACALRLVDQGRLDLDAPVARYWPEFARAGKETLPVHFLLSHRAGLPTVSEPLAPDAIYDWPTMTAVLAAQEPFWTPGTKHGYHAVTYGWLVGEVIRRITGPIWLRMMTPEGGLLKGEFERLLGWQFDSLLSAHGSYLRTGAHAAVTAALRRSFPQ